MEELQRWDLWRDPEFPNDHSIEKCHNGDFVLFSDVEARLGEKSGEIDRLSEELDQANARIRELETQLVDTERRLAAALKIINTYQKHLQPNKKK